MTDYDPLDRLVSGLQPRGAFLYRSDLAAPWGLWAPEGRASFHVVEQGACVAEVEGQHAHLSAGDLLVLPRGSAVGFRSGPDAPLVPVSDLTDRHPIGPDGVLRVGEGDDRTRLVCGALDFGDALRHPVLEALPAMLVVPSSDDASPWLRQTVGFLTCEAGGGRPGARAVMGHLGGILFVHAVRSLAGRSGGVGWIGALGDPHVGPTLRAIAEAPERRWTVEALGREAGLGRSAFAARFRDRVGETPMQHVTRWRLYRAGRLLRSPHTLADIAARVGYENEAAFGRAFKRWTGQTPGAVRSRLAQSTGETTEAYVNSVSYSLQTRPSALAA
jgi:AraC-like DNA-binding protein